MVNLSSLQNKINTKVFQNLGSSLLVSSVSGSTNDYGDKDFTYTSIGTVLAVPWNHIKNREDTQMFGELQTGEVDMAFKHDQSISVGYRVVLNSENYEIKQIESFPLKDGILVKVARLKKDLP